MAAILLPRPTPRGTWTDQIDGTGADFEGGVAYANGRWVAVGKSGTIITATDPTVAWSDDATSDIIFNFRRVAYGKDADGNDIWVAVAGDSVSVATDPTGTWSNMGIGGSLEFLGVTYANGRWVVVGNGGTIRVAPNTTP